MTQPKWIEAESQRIRSECRLARIEAAMGTVVVVAWVIVIVEAIRGFAR